VGSLDRFSNSFFVAGVWSVTTLLLILIVHQIHHRISCLLKKVLFQFRILLLCSFSFLHVFVRHRVVMSFPREQVDRKTIWNDPYFLSHVFAYLVGSSKLPPEFRTTTNR